MEFCYHEINFLGQTGYLIFNFSELDFNMVGWSCGYNELFYQPTEIVAIYFISK